MSLSLETIYKAILETGWLVVDGNGEVLRNLSAVDENETKNEPFILLDKKVALPTRNNLNRSGNDNLLIFHPLMEGLMGGESPVIGKLRRAYGNRMTFVGASLLRYLLSGASNVTEYDKFSPSQMRLFKSVKDINEKSLKQWDKIVRMSIEQHGGSNAIVDLYTKRNAHFKGQPCSRVAMVRFPIYEELSRTDKLIFGKDIALNSTDRTNFKAIFEFAFPGIEESDEYSYGTNSRIAPYLDSLLGAYGRLFSRVNAIYDEFSPVIVMDEKIKVEIEWVDWFKDIENLKNIAQGVPQQYGNYSIKVEDEKRQNTGSLYANKIVEKQTITGIGSAIDRDFSVVKQPSDTSNGYQQNVGNKQRDFHVEVPVKGEFKGIGRPLENANGIINKPEVNLEAVIISNSQSRVMLDPVKASINAAMDIIKQGGVGRVSAADVRPINNGYVPVNQQQQQFGNQQQQQFNNGWANSPINNQPPSVPTAQMFHDLAYKRLTSLPDPFSNNSHNSSII